jgi:TolB protein
MQNSRTRSSVAWHSASPWCLAVATSIALITGCTAEPARDGTPSIAPASTAAPATSTPEASADATDHMPAPVLTAPTAPPPSPSPAADACRPAEPFAIEDGEQWVVMQSLTTEFGPERCPDDADHDDTIYLVRPDGTGLHRLVPDEWAGSEIRPTWSPDGQRIAFIRARLPNDRGELWAINADGTGAELLYTCAGPLAPDSDCNSIEYPDWATDGAVYFSRDSNPQPDGPPATFEIMRHDPASGETTAVLTREDGMSLEQARLSPDASRAVYVRYRITDSDDEESALFVGDLATGDERQLVDWGVYAVAYPDWSANDQIAFNTWDLRLFPTATEAANLYFIDADGSDLRPLTDFGSNDTRATQPRWSADGCGLVYTEVRSTADPYGERHPAFMAIAEGEGCDGFEFDGSLEVVGTHPELRPLPSE